MGQYWLGKIKPQKLSDWPEKLLQNLKNYLFKGVFY